MLCAIANELPPAIPGPIQTIHQVRLDPLLLPGHSPVAAGDQYRRNRPVNPLLSRLTPAKGLFSMIQFLLRTFLQKYKSFLN